VFTRHLSLHATGTTPEPLSDLAVSIDLCCLPPHNMGVDGFLLIPLSGRIPIHLRCGLRAPCVRFTGFVPCGIRLVFQTGFSYILLSPPFMSAPCTTLSSQSLAKFY